MKNKQLKNETIALIKTMIDHADKGPSGFWTDDYEGCGNPDIFPEFLDGLLKGNLVQKKHFLCPWNKAVMYGEGHGNIHNGCYYSCSINDAKYLSKEMIETILKRFLRRLETGDYDNLDHIEPLLSISENNYIEKRKRRERDRAEQQEKQSTERRKKQAKRLLEKYASSDIQELISAYYGSDEIVDSGIGALIFFSPSSQSEVSGAEKISYDDYIDAQINSRKKVRTSFLNCYMNIGAEYCGEVERLDEKNKRICFNRIYVSGMFSDGTMFEGKEDHVWMVKDSFGDCAVGDCFSFGAEVYRYLKTKNGKMIDYGLRYPRSIQKINKYDLPSDEKLARQCIDRILCETCWLSDHCTHSTCIRNPKEMEGMRRQLLPLVKPSEDEV